MGARWVCVLVVVLCGCLESRMVECGDGTACPADYQCLPSGGCANAAQFAACAILAAGDSCFLMSSGHGFCVDGACVVPVCGNGRVELGEACDDGNDVSGDGCNATCTSNETCGNGVTDPGEECDCGTGSGALPATCTQPNDPSASNPAATCRGDCKIVRCGNGLIDYGEVCDDGNFEAGDGCAPDCKSNETCGNGVWDILAGEACDDGNTRSHDGCDKACRIESATWRQVGTAPAAREWASAVYDVFRARVVMFGGGAGSFLSNETFEWTGSAWVQRAPTVSPSPRLGHAMAYDTARHRVVLFGGEPSPAAVYDDTWEWDGASWVERVPAHKPPARAFHVMAYDIARGRVVMFGGTDGFNAKADTWEWDGNDWTQIMPAHFPSARSNAAMTYDPVRKRSLLAGGNGPMSCNDTWEWDGNDWTQRASSTPVGSDYVLMFDPIRGTVVAWGGGPYGVNAYLSEWNDASGSWGGVGTTGTVVPPLWDHAAAFDALHGSIVSFGGETQNCAASCTYKALDDTYVLTGTTWRLADPGVPGERDYTTMARDSRNGKIVMFSGYSLGDDTWLWDGATWAGPTVSAPAARYGHAMTDTGNGVAMFGGTLDGYDDLNDLWTWDAAWTEVSSGSGWTPGSTTFPSPRELAGLARDPNGLVLFGGTDDTSPDPDGDTWTWNGSAWSELSGLTSSPAAMASPQLVYDEHRGRTVLFGVPATPPAETWEWDGASWAMSLTATSPPAGGGLVYDPLRQRSVLWTMTSAPTAPITLGEVWDWDGTAWHSTPVAPFTTTAYTASGVAYDAVSSQVLLWASKTGTGAESYTFALRFGNSNAALDEVCDSGHDVDGDGKIGCADDECWMYCDPTCPPGAIGCAADRPRCGDGVCSALESYRSCPQDCTTPTYVCGDLVCDPGETCLGDCP